MTVIPERLHTISIYFFTSVHMIPWRNFLPVQVILEWVHSGFHSGMKLTLESYKQPLYKLHFFWRTCTQFYDFLLLCINLDTCSPLEFNSRKMHQHLTSGTRWSKSDKVWNNVNSFFWSDVFAAAAFVVAAYLVVLERSRSGWWVL